MISNDDSNRKKIRLLCFLFSAFLLITASAAVYNYLYINASPISAEAAKVRFVTGADSAATGASIGTNGTHVSFNSIAGWPNATRVYENSTGLQNADTGARAIELKFDSWSGDTSQIKTIYVKIFNAAGTQQGSTVNVGIVGSSTGQINIPASTTWRIQWDITWKAGALSTNSVSVALQLIVTGE